MKLKACNNKPSCQLAVAMLHATDAAINYEYVKMPEAFEASEYVLQIKPTTLRSTVFNLVSLATNVLTFPNSVNPIKLHV